MEIKVALRSVSVLMFITIQLRNIYFDRIERTAVESVIASIYQHVKSLEDMQFLVKYATQVGFTLCLLHANLFRRCFPLLPQTQTVQLFGRILSHFSQIYVTKERCNLILSLLQLQCV